MSDVDLIEVAENNAKRGRRKRMIGGIVAAAITAVVLVVVLVPLYATGGASQHRMPSSVMFERFDSCTHMQQIVEEANEVYGWGGVWFYYPWSILDGVGCNQNLSNPQIAYSEDSGGSTPKASADFSSTNNQVEKVDEADIVKTDGSYIYTLSNEQIVDKSRCSANYCWYDCSRRLSITQAYPSANVTIASVNLTQSNFSAYDMLIDHDRLVLMGVKKEFYNYNYADNYSPPEWTDPNPTTIIQLYDISNRANPVLMRTIEINGSYMEARQVDHTAYFVLNTAMKYKLLTSSVAYQVRPPTYRDSIKNVGTNKASIEVSQQPALLVGCGQVGYFTSYSPKSLVTELALSLQEVEEQSDFGREVVGLTSSNIFATTDALYVAAPSYGKNGYQESTVFGRFAFSGKSIKFTGLFQLPGTILNQFSMDEFKGVFRVATTAGNNWWMGSEINPSNSNVFMVDVKTLNVIGSVENFAQGERIYSVRFSEDTAYVVTFRQVDPLFVIDLSNPKNPQIVGELKIPGYSGYLHPVNTTHLIGVGMDASDKGVLQGVKISLFDVRDPTRPREQYSATIGAAGSTTPVIYDHKAFLFMRNRDMLALPVLETVLASGADWWTSSPVFQGLQLYKIDSDGFSLVSKFTHINEDYLTKKYHINVTETSYMRYSMYTQRGEQIRRSLYIGDVLYAVSNDLITGYNLSALASEALVTVRIANDNEDA